MENFSLWEEMRFRVDEKTLPMRADQLRSRLHFLPTMASSQILLEMLTVALLWDHASHTGLVVWFCVLLGFHLTEIGSWWFYRQAVETVKQCRVWSAVLSVYSGGVGVMWGIAAVCFFPHELAYQAMLICVILGLAAGAVTMNPVFPPSLFLFLGGVLPPIILRVAYENDSVHWILAGMLTLYTLVVGDAGRQLTKTMHDSLWRRYQNLSLVEQLTREKSRAETANREKSRFLATASHDLRQPLQALMLFSDALQDAAQEKQSKHLAEQISKSVGALVEMFDELLDVSKLEAGIVEVRWQSFALQPLLDRLYVDLAPVAQSKGLHFEMPNGDWVVYSDSFLLDRVLRNLISNAIRYTEQGTVSIRCEPATHELRFVVQDTGVGISPEALPHIFDEYYQVENQHRDHRKGLGLGLAIVRRVEGLLGCKVEVSSELGKGTRFSFAVRLGNPEHLAQPFVMANSRHDLRGVKVALVEDDPDIRQMVTMLMQEWGCEVFASDQPETFLRQLQLDKVAPDVLVCDYRLPNGLTAVEVIKRVRELWGGAVPALVLTGDTAPEALQAINATGSVLLHKPIAPSRLRTMVYFALHGES